MPKANETDNEVNTDKLTSRSERKGDFRQAESEGGRKRERERERETLCLGQEFGQGEALLSDPRDVVVALVVVMVVVSVVVAVVAVVVVVVAVVVVVVVVVVEDLRRWWRIRRCRIGLAWEMVMIICVGYAVVEVGVVGVDVDAGAGIGCCGRWWLPVVMLVLLYL